MGYLLVLYAIMMTVFLSFIIGTIIAYGILPSISDSYYRLPKKWNFLFTIFTWGYALPALIIGIELTNNFLMFLAGAGICFVGAAAQFKQKLTTTVHVAGALIGITSSQLSIAIDFKMLYVNIIFIVLALLFKLLKIKNATYWIEILAFISISYALGLRLYNLYSLI